MIELTVEIVTEDDMERKIVCEPPAEGYSDLNLAAFRLLKSVPEFKNRALEVDESLKRGLPISTEDLPLANALGYLEMQSS